MQVVISGAGSSGTYLAGMLYEAKKDIIVIDKSKERLDYIDSHFDFLTVSGSATSLKTLKQAGIENTNLYIAVTHSEETNIISAILAKQLGAKKVIARIDNREYLQEQNRAYFNDLGIDELIYPEILASEEVVSLLNQSGANKTYRFADGKLALFALRLSATAPIVGHKLRDITELTDSDFDFRVVAIIRNHQTLIPKGDDAFYKDDLIYAICNAGAEERILKYSGKEEFNIKSIMILGGSRIGWKSALRCETDSSVKLIEKDRAKCEQLTDYLEDTIIINGDGRDTQLLEEEGIESTDAFVAVTGDSETNILACLHAKKMGVKKTIAEIENMDYLSLAENMGIDAVINKKLITASYIFAHVISAQVASVKCLTGTQAEILEFYVRENTRITRKPLKDIKFPKHAIIGGVIRGKKSFIATGDTQLQGGDKVVVFTLSDVIEKVSKLFK